MGITNNYICPICNKYSGMEQHVLNHKPGGGYIKQYFHTACYRKIVQEGSKPQNHNSLVNILNNTK